MQQQDPRIDYYDILGLPRDATNEQLDAALADLKSDTRWGKPFLTILCTPDEKAFRGEVLDAYNALSNPNERAVVDQAIDLHETVNVPRVQDGFYL